MDDKNQHSAMSINDERIVFMKKKLCVMGIALMMLCAVAVIAVADARVSFTPNSVTVGNTSKKGIIPKVEVCVTLRDSHGRDSDTTWTFSDISAGRSKTQKALAGTTVVGASSTYCAAPVPAPGEE
jgi:hypothetical protein